MVAKLFNIVQPERAYFGQKDIQQTIVLKALVRDLHIPIELRVGRTVREYDGLALSSRNAYLDPSRRSDALILYRALKAGIDFYGSHATASATAILQAALDSLTTEIDRSDGRVSVEYLNIVHPQNLKLLTDADSGKGGILVGAIRLKGAERTIRLIDNLILE